MIVGWWRHCIPHDEADLDNERPHRKYGRITGMLRDDLVEVTNDERDAVLYRVELDSGETVDVRQRDVRPPLADE
jgi:hypothetical protein